MCPKNQKTAEGNRLNFSMSFSDYFKFDPFNLSRTSPDNWQVEHRTRFDGKKDMSKSEKEQVFLPLPQLHGM